MNVQDSTRVHAQLAFEAVDFRYWRRPLLFDGLSLTLEHFPVAILGPNGAGKSTLLGIADMTLAPSSGSVRFNDVNTSTRSGRTSLARSIGVLAQDVKIVRGLKVREQVAYAGWLNGLSKAEAWDAALAALQLVDLADQVDWRGSSLSGGQRRRLGIAQAIVHRPRLLLLDEPYAGLDPEQRGVLRDVLTGLNDSTAIIVATHHTEDLVESFASVVVIEGGSVLFSGRVDEFLSDVESDVPLHLRAEVAYRRLVSGRNSEG